MDPQKLRAVQSSYDALATAYVAHIFDELKDKPRDRELLDELLARTQALGPICDVGCGPGQVARYLHERRGGRGGEVLGLDLSPVMVDKARQLNPEIPFQVGNLLALTEVADASWGGAAAFYALVNLPSEDLPQALAELRRVLRPGGYLLVAFHIGSEVVHVEEMWGCAVTLDFVFFPTEAMTAQLRAAGFEVTDVIEREPYEGVEYPSRRAYLFARKP